MLIPFDPNKVIQASAVLLKEHANRMSRLRLLKELYVADRECLQETGRPITGDHAVAMKNGPVLTRTYDLIKGRDFASDQWQQFIGNAGPVDVQLMAEPGVGELSKFEIVKLQDVALRFAQWDDWDIADYTHSFEEWQRNRPEGNGVKRISLDDMLHAVGLLEHKADLLADSAASAQVDRLLASVAPSPAGTRQ